MINCGYLLSRNTVWDEIDLEIDVIASDRLLISWQSAEIESFLLKKKKKINAFKIENINLLIVEFDTSMIFVAKMFH